MKGLCASRGHASQGTRLWWSRLGVSAFLCPVRCDGKKRRVSPNSKTRFRWIQESSAQKNVPPFGLDGVYISEPCPSYCSGHGDCISGVCFCDLGYTGKANMCLWHFACESSFAHRQHILGLLLSVSKNSRTWLPKYLNCWVFCSFKPPRKKT